jgi:hypothetical protein
MGSVGPVWLNHRRFSRDILSPVFLLLFLLATPFALNAQNAYPGRGAVSAQDLAKLTAPAATGSGAADQVCARYAIGSIVSALPELESQNGVLEATMKFQAVTDSQVLIRYCYVTDTGLEAPTLRVNSGDQLIIHFQNDLPVSSASSDNMAGLKMTLSANDTPTTSTSSSCSGAMPALATNIHFHGTNESACFVDPSSMTGTGQVSPRVNTTSSHPLSSEPTGAPGWFAASRGESLVCATIGCGGAAKIDPGTPMGAYTVVVTGTAGTGSGQSKTSVNDPITIQ